MLVGMVRVEATPVENALRGAEAYRRSAGRHAPLTDYSQSVVSPGAVQRTAAAYNALPDFDRNALPAYHAMREETARQFDHLTGPTSKGGLGFSVDVSPEDPYDGSRTGLHSLFHDIQNQHIAVLSTKATGGHPVFSDDDNDMFRAVHDVFGHAGTGRGVDRHGEEAAYLHHATMYGPLARAALATETRGQNHAMIAAGGQFQAQKIGILPAHLRRASAVNPRDEAEWARVMLQARQFHGQQFGGPL